MFPRPLLPTPSLMFLACPAFALAGVEPDVGHEFFGALLAAHVPDDGQQRKGADETHAEHVHAAQCIWAPPLILAAMRW
jgi:hypothetical protein